MHPAAVITLRDAIDSLSNAHWGEIGWEAEGSEDVVEEDGDLETVTASAAGVSHDAGECVLGVDAVGVSGVVMEPEVFVRDC